VHCDSCDRTLLLGEDVSRFHDRGEPRNVCALCEMDALGRGWLREGAPVPPPQPRVERPGLLERLRQRGRRPPAPDPVERPEPAPRSSVVRIQPSELPAEARARVREAERAEAAVTAVSVAIAAFNESAYRRTIHGIAKTLGRPKVSVIPLGGIRPDVVVTIAWDISWYQYRVDPDAEPPVRLEGRGDEARELDGRWRAWNGLLDEDGNVAIP
jgi:hypothetical protein